MFSVCLCGFSAGSPASTHSLKQCVECGFVRNWQHVLGSEKDRLIDAAGAEVDKGFCEGGAATEENPLLQGRFGI